MSQRKPTKKAASTRKGADQPRPWMRRGLWGLGAVVLFGGAVLIALDVSEPLSPPPPELEAVETLEDMGVRHLADGEPVPTYNSDPPTSGPHSPTPAPCGVYRQAVPDVAFLHSMEHGAVVVLYDPDLPADQIAELEDVGRSIGGEIIVAPRPGNPAAVSVVAWTKLLPLDEVNGDVIQSFEREFGNRSPEAGAACPFEVDEGR